MKFSVLGPVGASDHGASLNLGGPKQRTVLALLIASFGSSVSVHELIDAIYGDEAAPGARRTIQTYVSNLRSVVGDIIEKTPSGWTFTAGRHEVDALVFEDLVASVGGENRPPEQTADVLREALGMWRGHPYVDVEARGALDPEITRLSELRIAAQAARIDADLASGRHADLIGEIEALLAEHPYQERFRGQHMLALYRSGRQKEALRSFAAMRELLADELGIDPTVELRDLEQRILEQDDSLEAPIPSVIQKRAVLVADPGDPIELARLGPEQRTRLLEDGDRAIRETVERNAGVLVAAAGVARYAVFDRVGDATVAAGSIAHHNEDLQLRVAVDFGDVETSDGQFVGVPVLRAARLVSTAHPGQVLLSPDAQQAATSEGRSGLRFEALGAYDISGVEAPMPVFQLLVGDPPRSFPPLVTDRVPPPLPGGSHRSIPGYELREPIGQGSIGTMYRAYQASVGREVAIEVIPRAESSNAEFIRRFEADTQRLSLLEHPHILQILDYWRDTDGAFIVYPYLRGGGLEDSLAAIDSDRAIAQIGSALAYAHSYGLAHGRLAPNRIVLDESGNTYLYGFPIAGVFTVDPDAATYRQDPAGEPTIAADLYSLGVIAASLRHGSEPDPDTPVPDVVAAATSVEQLLAQLLAPGDRPETRFTATRNPYKGLAAFHESDAADFYGRTAVTAELIATLAGRSFMTVVGPSGIGKSSVVRAGLVPALRNDAITGSEKWLITDMLPGADPFHELQRAIERVAVDTNSAARDALAEQRASALADLTAELPPDSELLLVIDQFEELFTVTPEPTAERFLDLLLEAAHLPHVHVVATLRADFLDRPLLFSEFGEVLRTGMVTLRSPNGSELAEALTKPAANLGVEVKPALVERMTAEVVDRPGALPLIQHAMTELFASRTSDVIDIGAYEDLGGVTGSIARRAEELYSVADDGDRQAVRQSFLRMVTIAAEATPTRRRVSTTELEELGAADLMRPYSAGRLLIADRDPVTRAPTIEIAHEALITHWPRLAGWVDDLREDLVLRRRLGESIAEWQGHDRDSSYLLTEARLVQHREWTGDTELALTETETEYLDASAAWNREQTAARRRRRRLILAGFAAAALIATVLAVAAVISAGEADRRRDEATQQRDEAQRQGELAVAAQAEADFATLIGRSLDLQATQTDLALLLAAEAYTQDPGFESQRALLGALRNVEGTSEVWTEPRFQIGSTEAFCALTPQTGMFLIQPNAFSTGLPDPGGEILDIDVGGRTIHRMSDSPVLCTVFRARFPDGQPPAQPWIYAGTDADGSLVTFHSDGTVIGTFDGLTDPMFDAAGRLLAKQAPSAGFGPFLEVDPLGGETISDELFAAEFAALTPGGGLLQTIIESRTEANPAGRAAFLDATTYEVVFDLSDLPPPASWDATSPDDSRYGYVDQDRRLLSWNVGTGELEFAVDVGRLAERVAYSPSGATIAVLVQGGTMQFRSGTDGTILGERDIGREPIIGLQWVDETKLAALRDGGVVDYVSLSGGGLYEVGPVCCDGSRIRDLVPDGDPNPYVAYGDPEERVMVDVVTGAQTTVDTSQYLDGAGGFLTPDQQHVFVRPPFELARVDRDGTASGWVTPFGTEFYAEDAFPAMESRSRYGGSEAVFMKVTEAAEPDGGGLSYEKALVGTIDLTNFEITEGPFEIDLRNDEAPTIFATVREGGYVVAEQRVGRELRQRYMDLEGAEFLSVTLPETVGFTEITLDGRYLLMEDTLTNLVHRLDTTTDEQVALPLVSDEPPHILSNGRFLVQNRSGQVELWDIDQGALIGVIADPGPGTEFLPGIHPDESHVWLILDGAWTKIPLDPDEWFDLACTLAGRSLTATEWTDLVPGDEPYRDACIAA